MDKAGKTPSRVAARALVIGAGAFAIGSVIGVAIEASEIYVDELKAAVCFGTPHRTTSVKRWLHGNHI
jgi:hypothetical protein